jgi:hypothetical protein
MRRKQTIKLIDTAIEQAERLSKVFCPTGQGGGVDPTCSPGGGRSGDGGGSGGDVFAHERGGREELYDGPNVTPTLSTYLAEGHGAFSMEDVAEAQGSAQSWLDRAIEEMPPRTDSEIDQFESDMSATVDNWVENEGYNEDVTEDAKDIFYEVLSGNLQRLRQDKKR